MLGMGWTPYVRVVSSRAGPVAGEDILRMSQKHRFPELDLLRFLAALAVMLFHYTYLGPRMHVWAASFPALGLVSRYGYLGVNVFFILSGFVILLTACNKNAIGFALARIIRLYPAYWICVTITALAVVLGTHRVITPGQYLANLTMVHSFVGIDDVSGVYWTLAVELKFYFLIFLVLAARQIHRLGALLGIWLLASVLLSLHKGYGAARFFLFPEWSSYFIAGAMCFLIHREGPSVYKFFVVAGCYLLSTAYGLGLVPAAAADKAPGLRVGMFAGLVAIFYIAFLAVALRPRPASGSKVLRILGLITYPLFLLHQDIGFILLRSAPSSLNQYLTLCAVIAAMIGLAWLVHIGPERWLASRMKSKLAPAVPFSHPLANFIKAWLARLEKVRSRPRSTAPDSPAQAPLAAVQSRPPPESDQPLRSTPTA
jgi:peptidoglycan/LPS O-acetylase OafA/YrhL